MISKIFKVLDRRQKIHVSILLIMIIIGALMETIGVSAILPLVSAVTDPSIIETNKWFALASDVLNIGDYKSMVLFMAIMLIIVYVIKNCYLIFLNNTQNKFYINNERRFSVRLMTCYMLQDYLYHSEHNAVELQRNADMDAHFFMYVLTNILQLFTEALVCLMLVTFLVFTDPFTTILLVILLGFFLLFFVKIIKKSLKRYGIQSRDYDEKRKQYFLEAFGGVKEVKANGLEAYFIDRYDQAFATYANAVQKSMTYSYIPKPIMESLCICGLLFFMTIRILMGIDVSTFIPVLSVFAVAAIRMLPSFNRISGYLGSIIFHKASIDALYKDIKEAEILEKKYRTENGNADSLQGDIEVNNVTFYYPAKPDKIILDNVALKIPCNKSVALVGPSGAGKTTLADLVLGVLEPEKGNITVGGKDIHKNAKAWQKQIGYIPQLTFLLDGTIRDNVAFGIRPEDVDDQKVWDALDAAQIGDYVREQPGGIYSNIGERGVKVSGGQRQRIGIARALYNNPSVIALDEATSALDNDTEKAVMDAIYRLSGQKTMVIIAHRLTTIENCDLIYEVKDGKVKTVKYDEYVNGK